MAVRPDPCEGTSLGGGGFPSPTVTSAGGRAAGKAPLVARFWAHPTHQLTLHRNGPKSIQRLGTQSLSHPTPPPHPCTHYNTTLLAAVWGSPESWWGTAPVRVEGR